LFP
jgi:hypothetical protein